MQARKEWADRVSSVGSVGCYGNLFLASLVGNSLATHWTADFKRRRYNNYYYLFLSLELFFSFSFFFSFCVTLISAYF